MQETEGFPKSSEDDTDCKQVSATSTNAVRGGFLAYGEPVSEGGREHEVTPAATEYQHSHCNVDWPDL